MSPEGVTDSKSSWPIHRLQLNPQSTASAVVSCFISEMKFQI
jgi:hypothetical protein